MLAAQVIVSWLTHDGLPTAQFSRMVSVLQHYITVYIYSAQARARRASGTSGGASWSLQHVNANTQAGLHASL